MSKIVVCEAAALHLLDGALEKRPDVPVGNHNLSNLRGTFTFPDFAAVVRGEGTAGDGFNATAPAMPLPLMLGLQPVLLFLERSMLKGGARARKLWAECIVDSMKGLKGQPPKEATEALAEVQAALPPPTPGKPGKVRVAAKRVGTEGVKISIETTE